MDKTANSTFSSRSNAKRAAEKLVAAGTAPAVDYGIKERQDGRFEIKWKTTPVPTGVSEPPASTRSEPGRAGIDRQAVAVAGVANDDAIETGNHPGRGGRRPGTRSGRGSRARGVSEAAVDRRVGTARLSRHSRAAAPRQAARKRAAVEQDEAARRGRRTRRHADQAARHLARQPSLPEALRRTGRVGRGRRLGRSGRVRVQRRQ